MHAFAIVLVKDAENIYDEVARLLAPYNEDMGEDWNPTKMWWDWWRIGGRWDGMIRGLEPLDDGRGGFNFGDEWETLERNTVPVIEMGECRPFTIVTPDGVFLHREGWAPAPEDEGDFPWKCGVATVDYERKCAEILLAHRDCIAVGVDYHS